MKKPTKPSTVELTQLESKFSALFDLTKPGIGIVNTEGFNTMMKEAWPEIMRQNAFLGLPVYDFIPIECPERHGNNFESPVPPKSSNPDQL